MLDVLKPDSDKLALMAMLFIMYWVTALVSGWITDYLHGMANPLLVDPIPYTISLSQQWLDIFARYRDEVALSRFPFVGIEIFISLVSGYLGACLIVFSLQSSLRNESTESL